MTIFNRAIRALPITAVALMLACTAQAVGFSGSYTYKLILRDDQGFALSGEMTQGGDDEKVSSNYKIEVYTSDGVKLNARVDDAALVDDGQTVGHNCVVSVPVGLDSGYAKIGEQLTLVVTEKYSDTERFRSSKVLPPVGGMFGIADSPVGVFWSDSTDEDRGWDAYRRNVEWYTTIGGPDEDYDGDGLSNLREYQLGTDPAGGTLELVNTPGFSIVETDGVYKVSFNYGWGHVYSVRAIEGTEAVGRDGQDLTLYESLENLKAGTAFGTYFYDSDYNTGTKVFYVKKPNLRSYIIGLAVDGRLQEYDQVGSSESSLTITPGFPIEYASESEALAAKAIAEIVPSESVAAVLTGEGMADGYKAKFTVEVQQEDGKWFLAAELTPEAWTNLMENATAAARQIPVAEIADLPMESTTNVVLTGCVPGFYYSLNSGTEVTNIAADAEAENLGVLCGADGVVVFPKVKKPGEGAGFFKVKVQVKSE